jgi:tRNA (cytidine32/uridine32-2'-O)-methyltransferase
MTDDTTAPDTDRSPNPDRPSSSVANPESDTDPISLPTPTVVVVEPTTRGNIGTIARAMKNFGFSDLRLVSPPAIEPGDEAFGFAGHAREDVLANHTVTTVDRVIETYHTIAFTAHPGEDERRHVRYPFASPAELASDLAETPPSRPIAFVFGREDSGLSNAELARMDEICSIPANTDYPVLNLGQAATVALYELRELATDTTQHASRTHASAEAMAGLYDQLDALLVAIGHPEEKRPKAARLFRRVFGRARLTGREASTLRGIARRATELTDDPGRDR